VQIGALGQRREERPQLHGARADRVEIAGGAGLRSARRARRGGRGRQRRRDGDHESDDQRAAPHRDASCHVAVGRGRGCAAGGRRARGRRGTRGEVARPARSQGRARGCGGNDDLLDVFRHTPRGWPRRRPRGPGSVVAACAFGALAARLLARRGVALTAVAGGRSRGGRSAPAARGSAGGRCRRAARGACGSGGCFAARGSGGGRCRRAARGARGPRASRGSREPGTGRGSPATRSRTPRPPRARRPAGDASRANPAGGAGEQDEHDPIQPRHVPRARLDAGRRDVRARPRQRWRERRRRRRAAARREASEVGARVADRLDEPDCEQADDEDRERQPQRALHGGGDGSDGTARRLSTDERGYIARLWRSRRNPLALAEPLPGGSAGASVRVRPLALRRGAHCRRGRSSARAARCCRCAGSA